MTGDPVPLRPDLTVLSGYHSRQVDVEVRLNTNESPFPPPREWLDELRDGVAIDGVHYREIEATLDRVQGSNLWLTFAIREGTAIIESAQACGLSKLPGGECMSNSGIRYSNIEPDHETSAEPLPTGVSARPRRNQCLDGTSPLAMAMKLQRRASEASKS